MANSHWGGCVAKSYWDSCVVVWQAATDPWHAFLTNWISDDKTVFCLPCLVAYCEGTCHSSMLLVSCPDGGGRGLGTRLACYM